MHPHDKKHRQTIGIRKSEHRIEGWDFFSEEHKEEFKKYLRNTTKACSCYMCGNPRKLGGRDAAPVQERKADEDMENQLKGI